MLWGFSGVIKQSACQEFYPTKKTENANTKIKLEVLKRI